MEKNTKEVIEWHPAFEASIQANWKAMKEVKPSMCDALKELMAEEFEEVTEKVTDEVTTQMIKNVYDSVSNIEKVAELLKLPVETVKKAIE